MQIIKFLRDVSYLGRNRRAHMVGVEVLKTRLLAGDILTLTPVNNRGVSQGAYMEIPVEQVKEVVAAILYEAGVEHFEYGTQRTEAVLATPYKQQPHYPKVGDKVFLQEMGDGKVRLLVSPREGEFLELSTAQVTFDTATPDVPTDKAGELRLFAFCTGTKWEFFPTQVKFPIELLEPAHQKVNAWWNAAQGNNHPDLVKAAKEAAEEPSKWRQIWAILTS